MADVVKHQEEKFRSEKTIESGTANLVESTTTTQVAGEGEGLTTAPTHVKITERVETVSAEQLLKESQLKKREAEDIEREELRLAESAAKSMNELRRKIKIHQDKANSLEKDVNAAIEEERRLENLRVQAHERAVRAEQTRAEAEAMMHAAEVQLDTVIREEEKHRLASDQARALIGKYELDIQQYVLMKRQEEYNLKHKEVFERKVEDLEQVRAAEDVVVVPREIPEQITITDTKTQPVHLTVQPKIIPAATIAEAVDIEKTQLRREVTETRVEGEEVRVKSSVETQSQDKSASKTVVDKPVK